MASLLLYLVGTLVLVCAVWGLMKDVRCPVMVLHSREDELVPFAFAMRLFEAADEPKQFVELVGNHSEGFLLSGDVYTGAWRKWLDSVKNYQAESIGRGVS